MDEEEDCVVDTLILHTLIRSCSQQCTASHPRLPRMIGGESGGSFCKGRTFSLLLLTALVAEFINLRLNYFSIRVLSQLCEFLTINFIKRNDYMIYVIIDVTNL